MLNIELTGGMSVDRTRGKDRAVSPRLLVPRAASCKLNISLLERLPTLVTGLTSWRARIGWVSV